VTDILDSTGLYIDDLQTRLDRIKAELRSTISTTLDLTDNDPLGQATSILANSIQEIAEIIQLAYNAWDPDQATGFSLQALGTITGSERNPATAGTITLRCNLDGSTTLPAGSIAGVPVDSENRWATNAAYTSPAGPAANYDIAATCINTGEIEAPSGTVTQIVTPVGGWNSVTNPSDATPGQDIETDVALRLRREQGVFLGGSTSVEAIQSALSVLEDIIHVIIYENTKWYTVSGYPPHCVVPVIWDGSPPAAANADIAEAIFDNKAGGIESFGTTIVAHEDTQGESHSIGFYRATQDDILVEIWVVVDSTYVGDTEVENAIAAEINALSIGDDVPRSLVVDAASDVTGVVSVEMVNGGNEPKLSISPAAVAASDVTIGDLNIARVTDAAANITVHS
jgi:uncharacterized phage protein gp47/JayE